MNTGLTFNLLMRQKKVFYGKDSEANPWRSNYLQ